MSEIHQIGKDLQFVKEVVDRRQRHGGVPVLAYLWATYVLIGYTLMDININAAGMFFAIGGFVGGIASWRIGRWYALRTGQSDRSMAKRALLHFGGGILLGWIFCIALAAMIEPLRGPKGSQVFVVMIGMVYFLWGVHEDRYFLWLGPVLMAGGVLVGFFPHFGWTALGIVIALGLILPTFKRSKPSPSEPQVAA